MPKLRETSWNGTRRSVRRSVSVSGIGLHSGAVVRLRFHSAPAHTGVVFRRGDLRGRPEVPARLDAVHTVDRRTVLARGDARVETVEHVMAAVSAHAIDDLLIELDGPEPPIGDGSAAPFFEALQDAGPVAVGGERRAFRVGEPFTMQEGDAEYDVRPGACALKVTVEWNHPVIGVQSAQYGWSPDEFRTQLATARTFGFLRELDDLRARGLIRGGDASNAVVLSDTAVVNGELRWEDEFARHKVVDLIGDLALLGGQVVGVIEARKPSHRGNVALARAIQRRTSIGGS